MTNATDNATLCQWQPVRPGGRLHVCPVCEATANVTAGTTPGRRVCGPRVTPAKPPRQPEAKPTPKADPQARERGYRETVPDCPHRLPIIQTHVPCELCGAKGDQYDLYGCAIHGQCSLGKRAKGLKSCAGCEDNPATETDGQQRPVVKMPRSSAKGQVFATVNTPPTPLPAKIDPTRNLIYHVWPTRKSDAWRWNVQQLCQRMGLFAGVRSIAVATDDTTHSLAEVQAEFARHGVGDIDHWIERANDPRQREGATFLDLLQTIPRDDSVTWYGHAKGVSHAAGSPTLEWADLMYRATLDDWPAVRSALEQFPIAGCFKRYDEFRLPDNHGWHYSGTFFWFRNRETFNRPTWHRIHREFFACIEAWPANIYRATEAACLFGDDPGNLYQPETLAKWKEAYRGHQRAKVTP